MKRLLSRRTRLENRLDKVVEVEVVNVYYGGEITHKIKIDVDGFTEIGATKYKDQVGLEVTVILKLLVDGEYVGNLNVIHPRIYAKITFSTDLNGDIKIVGVKAKWYHLCRIWGFGFLGRDYKGRPEYDIKVNESMLFVSARPSFDEPNLDVMNETYDEANSDVVEPLNEINLDEIQIEKHRNWRFVEFIMWISGALLIPLVDFWMIQE